MVETQLERDQRRTDNDNKGNKENGDCLAIIVDRTAVFLVRVDCHVEKTKVEETNNIRKLRNWRNS